jgi:sulfur carrier protein|tara:strand:+ start:786 stop:1004 length:219 start_codon:yes stop_codon:yes gene_type:complete
MKKIKKIKIRLNGKTIIVNNNLIIDRFLKKLRIPIKKVAIELNNEILDKKKLEKIVFKNNDKIEIVHFIGGG